MLAAQASLTTAERALADHQHREQTESAEGQRKLMAASNLIAELQQERIRLENELRELEQSLSASYSHPSSGQRQVSFNL